MTVVIILTRRTANRPLALATATPVPAVAVLAASGSVMAIMIVETKVMSLKRFATIIPVTLCHASSVTTHANVSQSCGLVMGMPIAAMVQTNP